MSRSVPRYIVDWARLSDNARLAQPELRHCDIPGRGDGIGRRSGLKHRRRKAWGFDFPPRHQSADSALRIASTPDIGQGEGDIPDYT